MEQELATLHREVPEVDSLHNVICQEGDRRSPAHSLVLASGSESLSKQLKFAELQEEQEQVEDREEEVHPDIFQWIQQCLYTKSSDLFHDGATAAGFATLKRQEQQGIPKVRGPDGDAKTLDERGLDRTRNRKHTRDHTAKRFTETHTKRLAKDHAEKRLTVGGYSYPLVDPRPVEVPHCDSST